MNDGQRRRNERVQRVIVYMDTPNEDFPEDSKGAVLTARLREIQAEVIALELEREANATKRRQGTEGREEIRTTLREMVKATWGTHKTVARDHPDLKGLLESPSKIKNDQMLVMFARAYVAAVMPYVAFFAEYGITAAFLNEMRLKADGFESYGALQDAGVGAGVNLTVAVEEKLRQADEIIERLDTVVRNKYRRNPAKLAAWESAVRVERARRRKPEEDDGEPPQPPPAND